MTSIQLPQAPAHLSLVAMLALCGCSTQREPENDVNRPGLRIDSSALNLGKVLVHSAYRCRLPLTNETDHKIGVLGIEPACQCSLKSHVDAFALAPRGTEVITLELDLSSLLGEKQLTAPTAFSATFRVLTDDSALERVTFTIEAEVLPSPVEFDPPALDCGSLVVGEKWPTFSAHVRTLKRGIDLRAVVPSPKFDGLQLIASEDGTSAEIRLTPSGKLPPGHFRELTEILLKGHDDEDLKEVADPRIAIEVTASIRPLVEWFPQTFAWGNVAVGEERSDTVTFTAHGRRITAEYIQPSIPSNITVTQQIEDKSDSHSTWQIVMKAQSQGPQTENLTFRTTVDGKSESDVRIPVAFYSVRK